MTESLDDLAAFLMHHTTDEGMPEEQRLAIFVLVGAYQEQDDPTTVAAALRNEAAAFAGHPGYRAEWAVQGADEGVTIERLIATAESDAAEKHHPSAG